MATRPIFVPSDEQSQLVLVINADFAWHAGFAPSQKRKNIAALHDAGKTKDIWPILEISTKSDIDLGFRLSAFNLKVEMDDGQMIPLESAFQGSKIFSGGGPFTDLYGRSGFDIKRDERILKSGELRGFIFQGINWQLEPKTAFYDWLYIHSVHREPDLRTQLLEFNGFTDIEFNPKRSVNCQARACALYVSLNRRNKLNYILDRREEFISLLMNSASHQQNAIDKKQGKLF